MVPFHESRSMASAFSISASDAESSAAMSSSLEIFDLMSAMIFVPFECQKRVTGGRSTGRLN